MDIPQILADFCAAFLGFLKFFYCLLVIDIYLGWFPAMNPWYPPITSIRKITGPYLRLWRHIWPSFWIVDMSAIIAFQVLNEFMDWLVNYIRYLEKLS